MKDKYKRYKEWCPHCDSCRVEAGRKCPVCHKRCFTEKIKKPTNSELLKEVYYEFF